MTDYANAAVALEEAQNIFSELRTRELQIIWEHSFQNVDENSGSGISSKFFDFSGVTRTGPDVEVPEGGYIQTKETGQYGAGQPVIAGGAGQWANGPPSGDQDSYLGYYDRSSGIGGGAGWKYFDGTGPASEAGEQMYAFLEQDGEGRDIVPQENWNLNKLDGTENEGPDVDPEDGITLRLPHACYGHSVFIVVIGVKKDTSASFENFSGLRRVSDAFELYPVHAFVVKGDTMFREFDLPFVFETTGTEGDNFRLEATACHYEGETGRGIKRLNGAVWSVLKNGGSELDVPAFPDWQYVMSVRKRAGWETANITPSAFTMVNDNDVEVAFTVGADLSNTAYGLPPDTSTEEAAAEYDLVSWDIGAGSQKGTNTTVNGRGEREFITLSQADKNDPTSLSGQLDKVVLAGQDALSMFVRRASGNNTAINGASMGNGGDF